MDPKKQTSVPQREMLDDEVVPPQNRIERHASTRSGRVNGPPRRSSKRMQYPLPEEENKSAWGFRAMIEMVSPASKRASSKQRGKGGTIIEIREPQEWDCESDQTQGSQQQFERGLQFKDILKEKECEWIDREDCLRRRLYEAEQNMVKREQILLAEIHEIQQAKPDPEKQHHQPEDKNKETKCECSEREEDLRRKLSEAEKSLVKTEQVSQAKIHKLHLAKSALEEQHNTFIRKQQETSFRQMESARWRPVDETKVISDLDKLKRDMRSWAKTVSIKDISMLQSLEKEKYVALMEELSEVVVLDDGHLPGSISSTAKSPLLLLNALLANHIYMTLFQNPFFFLKGVFDDSVSVLENVYQGAKSANTQDAHAWRSQTLRLLMPPLRNDMSDGEKKLYHTTEAAIKNVAQQEAAAFLDGPASFLVGEKTRSDVANKLKKIYDEAARQSYILWTRRIDLRCHTLRDIGNVAFDHESQFFDPDNLVRHDDHEDQLKGRPVSTLVHPVLCVAGTDEGNDYDRERVWVKGVVWLDSKVE